MTRILIDVYLPAAQKSYDILIPADMYLAQVTALVSEAISQLTESLYSADKASILCDRESGEILNINMTAWNLGLRNGSKLMLI